MDFLNTQDIEGKEILDMGTGSGALAKKCLEKNAKTVKAIDINLKAIKKAKKRLKEFENVEVIKSDLYSQLNQQNFDIILFNPPYLPVKKKEPKEIEKAWAGGEKGIKIINTFLKESKDHLKKNGEIFLLVSNLLSIDELEDMFRKQDFKYEICSKKGLFFEKLIIYKAKAKLS